MISSVLLLELLLDNLTIFKQKGWLALPYHLAKLALIIWSLLLATGNMLTYKDVIVPIAQELIALSAHTKVFLVNNFMDFAVKWMIAMGNGTEVLCRHSKQLNYFLISLEKEALAWLLTFANYCNRLPIAAAEQIFLYGCQTYAILLEFVFSPVFELIRFIDQKSFEYAKYLFFALEYIFDIFTDVVFFVTSPCHSFLSSCWDYLLTVLLAIVSVIDQKVIELGQQLIATFSGHNWILKPFKQPVEAKEPRLIQDLVKYYIFGEEIPAKPRLISVMVKHFLYGVEKAEPGWF